MRQKLVIWIVLGLMALPSLAQNGRKNLASFDNKRYHFGFILSGNKSDFRFDLKQDTAFSTGLYGIENSPQGGFNLALLASFTINRHLRLRFTPGLSFQDRGLAYSFSQNSGGINQILRRTESVNLDVPILLKNTNRSNCKFCSLCLNRCEIQPRYAISRRSESTVTG